MLLPTAKESTVQPSSSFVMSKYNVKQTKAQVYESSSSSSASANYSVIKPTKEENSERMLEEYMSKLNQLEEKKTANGNSKQPVASVKVFNNAPKRSESSDNVLTNEFMRVREEKFGKVLSNEAEENQKNLAKSSSSKQVRTTAAVSNGKYRPNNDSAALDETTCLLNEISGIMGELFSTKLYIRARGGCLLESPLKLGL